MSTTVTHVFFERDGKILYGLYNTTVDFSPTRLWEDQAHARAASIDRNDPSGNTWRRCACGAEPEPVQVWVPGTNMLGRSTACRSCLSLVGGFSPCPDEYGPGNKPLPLPASGCPEWYVELNGGTPK